MLNDIEATIKFYNAFYNVYFTCEKNEIISNDLNGLSHNAINNNDLSWIFAWGGRFGWV